MTANLPDQRENDKIILRGADAIALLVGRLIMAWGELDFRIEALLGWMWEQINEDREDMGLERITVPADGRAKHRMKELRRAFVVMCGEDVKALSQFDKVKGRYEKLEKLRSAVAHGIIARQGRESVETFGVNSFGPASDASSMKRGTASTQFTIPELESATGKADKVREEFESLITFYTREFIMESLRRIGCELPFPRNTPPID